MAGCPKHVYKRYDFPTINYSRENKSTAETKEEPCEAKCDNDDNCEGFYYVRDLCYIIRTSTSNTTTKGINKTPYFIKDRDNSHPNATKTANARTEHRRRANITRQILLTV